MRIRGRRRRLTVVGVLVAVPAAVAAVSMPWHASVTDDEALTHDSVVVGHHVVHYVALGSSYAAGPDAADIIDRRCQRSGDDYPHRVAAAESMELTDVSCSGSTIPDILRRAQPGRADRPQIDAVTADTDLVTVTTGGNDVHYIPRLTDLSCANQPARGAHRTARHCHPERPSSLSGGGEYAATENAMVAVVDAVRARAPRAVVVIVDYIPVLDQRATLCAAVPLTPAQAVETVQTFDRLTEATRAAASRSGAILVDAAAAADGHTVCSSSPWVSGFVPPAPYHPNAAGRAAMADLTLAAIRASGVVSSSTPS